MVITPSKISRRIISLIKGRSSRYILSSSQHQHQHLFPHIFLSWGKFHTSCLKSNLEVVLLSSSSSAVVLNMPTKWSLVLLALGACTTTSALNAHDEGVLEKLKAQNWNFPCLGKPPCWPSADGTLFFHSSLSAIFSAFVCMAVSLF